MSNWTRCVGLPSARYQCICLVLNSLITMFADCWLFQSHTFCCFEGRLLLSKGDHRWNDAKWRFCFGVQLLALKQERDAMKWYLIFLVVRLLFASMGHWYDAWFDRLPSIMLTHALFSWPREQCLYEHSCLVVHRQFKLLLYFLLWSVAESCSCGSAQVGLLRSL